MATETIEILIDGGKATPGPPLGPAIGPLGINMMQVVEQINQKTADFEGMKVPVKIIVDTETRDFEVKVGTPNHRTDHGRTKDRKSIPRPWSR